MRTKNLLLTSVIAIIAAIGLANANIDAGSNSADCDDATLGVESGATNLEAQWQANTITLKWYDDDTQFTPTNNANAGTCTYDGALTVPSDTLSKTGYTFDGWTVRAAALSCLANIDISIAPDVSYSRTTAASGGCFIDSSFQKNCSASPDLAVYEYRTEFSYGTIRGLSKCSTKSGDNHSKLWGGNSEDWTATEDELNVAASGRYCWCKFTSFTPKINGVSGETCIINDSLYVFRGDEYQEPVCTEDCARACTTFLKSKEVYREAIFSTVQ